MKEKARNASHHPEFGKFLCRELSLLKINRESFRESCHMKQTFLEDIKKGSITTR